MTVARNSGWKFLLGAALVVTGVGVAVPRSLTAQSSDANGEVTFTKDIAPILQRSCENCHRADGVAPMSLVDLRGGAAVGARHQAAHRHRPARRRDAAVVRREEHRHPAVPERSVAERRRDREDRQVGRQRRAARQPGRHAAGRRSTPTATSWAIGTPDLIVKTNELTVKGDAPDWWGEIPSVPTGLTEDRYVAALEIKEVNDVDTTAGTGRATVGGRFVFHHMIWSTRVLDDDQTSDQRSAGVRRSTTRRVDWPVHEVGRNADFFDPKSARLLKAGSSIVSDSVHLHSNGRDTKAHLEIGFKFMPKDYKPTYKRAAVRPRQRRRHRHPGRWKPNQQLHAYTVLQREHQDHLVRAAPARARQRMCLEAIWGYNIQTLNCVGYDHNWVRGYDYTDDSAPLLPKGTILHIIGYMDNSPSNKNVPDPRNWQGSGNRSVANMFIDLGKRVALTDEQFQEEMAKRREQLHLTQERQRHRLPAVHGQRRRPRRRRRSSSSNSSSSSRRARPSTARINSRTSGRPMRPRAL